MEGVSQSSFCQLRSSPRGSTRARRTDDSDARRAQLRNRRDCAIVHKSTGWHRTGGSRAQCRPATERAVGGDASRFACVPFEDCKLVTEHVLGVDQERAVDIVPMERWKSPPRRA